MALPCWWLLCLVALSFWSIPQASGYYQVMDCCVRTSPVFIPAKYVRGYREQHIQEGCPVQAVICCELDTPAVPDAKQPSVKEAHGRLFCSLRLLQAVSPGWTSRLLL
ncbi:C-C motif chemokine 21 isoform X1 [Rhineura floridana]|uniref:C-C motif chemokine 21 isoform X1 n=1 Tax=Rhineura floridana TaxID=261503 RepID=UPI002AC8744F|nr:C-C motif chemokine 21 isoform X1 [Rhineura floridana]